MVDGGRFILGPEVEAFEREFADYLGVRHCIGVANGTDAITIALRALGVGPGDEVVCPSYTFYASVEATVNAGATPVFCDVDPETACVTPETVKAAITPRTKAIMAVHLFGNVAPVPELPRAGPARCSRTRLRPPARSLDGRRAGALGDAATFSFFPSKNLPCLGDGGAVVTDDDDVARLARRLRFHGSDDKTTFVEVGYNSRLDELQAAALRILLPELDGWTAARARGGRGLRAPRAGRARGAAAAGGRAPSTPTTCTWCAASVRTSWPAALAERGVGARAYYRVPVHRQPAMARFAARRAARHRRGGPHGPGAADGHRPHRRGGRRGGRGVRVWVDLTNSPHVLVMRAADRGHARGRPRGGGHRARLRPDAGAVRAPRHRAHGGRPPSRRAAGEQGRWGCVSRSAALARWARRRRFDVAMGHGSNDVTVAAALLRIPSATAFDYEWATVQHNVNCRLARAVVVPDAIPPERLERYGARGKLRPYEGLKEEYYLADFEPDAGRARRAGPRPGASRSRWCAPRPTYRCTTGSRTRCSARCWSACGARRPWCCRAPPLSGARSRRSAASSCPTRAIDAQSLIAFADLVISAGGTMNREAVALGTPVFTTFEGRLGAVDEGLLREGRLRRLEDAGQVRLEKRPLHESDRIRRDPRELTKLLLSATER